LKDLPDFQESWYECYVTGGRKNAVLLFYHNQQQKYFGPTALRIGSDRALCNLNVRPMMHGNNTQFLVALTTTHPHLAPRLKKQ
jgi:hypothetical protein